MKRHRLPDAREVYLVRLGIESTYAGMQEGTPESASPYIMEKLPERAARVLSPAEPLIMVPPPRMPLPDWLCVAELGSQHGARETDPDFFSRLYVCWFAKDTTRSIDKMIDAVLPHLNWDRFAEDYNMMDF